MADLKTREEVISAIAARAKVEGGGGDNFRVKIERRRTVAALPELIATLDDACVDNFATPESWVPQFVGGGILTLKVFHASDLSNMVGLVNDTFPGMAREPDMSVFERSDWRGPRTLVFPLPKAEKPTVTHYGSSQAAPPTGNNVMPRTSAGGSGDGGLSLDAESRFAARFDAIQRAELDLAERRKQVEVDAAKRDADTRIRAAEDRVKEIERQFNELRRAPPAPPASDAMAQLIAQMRQSDIESKRADREMSIRLAELQQQAQIEAAKLQAEATRSAAAANQTLLQALLAKPAIDPMVMEMIAKNDTSKVLADMSSVVTASMSNQLNVMSAMMEMGYGKEQAAPVARVAKESSWDKAAKILVPIVTRALAPPPGNVASPQQVVPPVGHVQPQPQQQQQLPPAPAAPPAPTQPPLSLVPPPTTPAATGVVEQIAQAIKQRKGTPAEIAQTILQNFSDPAFQELAVKSGGDPRVLFDSLLGDWLDDRANRVFAGEVLKVTLEQGAASGVLDGGVVQHIPELVQSLIDSEVVDEATPGVAP